MSLLLNVMLFLCLNSLWGRKPVGQLPGAQGTLSCLCAEIDCLLHVCSTTHALWYVLSRLFVTPRTVCSPPGSS